MLSELTTLVIDSTDQFQTAADKKSTAEEWFSSTMTGKACPSR